MSSAGGPVSTITNVSADDSHRSSRLANLLIVAAWVAVALIANVAFALLPAKAPDAGSQLLPQDAKTAAATSRIAHAFPGTGTNAIAYLVLEGGGPLAPEDQRYYDAAVGALRADTAHVGSVLDLWSDPLTAPLGTSADGRSGIAMVWLVGEAGSAKAKDSLDAARSDLRKVPLNAGLRARIAVSETTSHIPLYLNAWQGATILGAAALIAMLLMLRARLPRIAAAIMLLAAGLSLAVAWPLAGALRGLPGASMSGFTVFSATLSAVLAIGTITASTILVARRRPDSGAPDASATQTRGYRDILPALALPGVCTAMLTGPLLLARTPALHSVGTAVLGVVVALAASLTLLPALTGLARAARSSSPASAPASSRTAAWRPRRAIVTAIVLAICALPVIGMRSGLTENPAGPAGAGRSQVLPGNPLPDVVVLEAAQDLRDPAGLIAIDQVSHRLMEIPGVRKVQSAAWPGGIPPSDASLTSALGKLSDQLDRGAGTFVPQVNAIKTLGTILDQMNGAVAELEKTVNAGIAAANQIEPYIDLLLSNARMAKELTVGAAGYLEPVRGWMGGVQNCPADVVCSAVRQAVEGIDKAVTDVVSLSNGADRVAAASKRAIGSFDSIPRVMAQMKSSLAQLQSFVPNLETTIQNALPQIVQMSAFLRNVSTDFANTGEGGFYMPRKALSDPSYQHVRQSMFSPDGTVTRLFVYSDGANLDLDAAARTQQLETAAGKAMKYGSLVDGKITVSGAAQAAGAVRGAVSHDAVLLAVMLLAVIGLVGIWRGAVSAAAVGLAMLASYLAALGISIVVWQHLLGGELQAAVPLVSFAILAACGVPFLVATLFASLEATSAPAASVRGAIAPLTALGAVFGGGLMLVSGGSPSASAQVGAVLVIGLGALTVAARAWFPATRTHPR